MTSDELMPKTDDLFSSCENIPPITPIVFPAALDYWLGKTGNPPLNKLPADNSKKFRRVSLPRPYTLFINETTAMELNTGYGFQLPVSVVSLDDRKRHSGVTFKSPVLSTLLPPESFVKIDPSKNIFVACPELCLVQAAKHFPLHEIVEIACNLCAVYCLDESSKYNQSRRDAVTTVSDLNAYIKKAACLPGTNKARTAMQYATGNSNSPVESKLATMFRLPFFRGGYGFPEFGMNFKVQLSSRDYSRFNIQEIHTDFGWEEQKLVVEYDSNMTHLDAEQHFYDKNRSNIIACTKYNLLTLTSKDISSLTALDHAAKLIRSRLGERQCLPKYDKYAELRWTVYNSLFRKPVKSYTSAVFGKLSEK